MSTILFYAQQRELGRNDYLIPSQKGGHISKERADQIIKDASTRQAFSVMFTPTCFATATPSTS